MKQLLYNKKVILVICILLSIISGLINTQKITKTVYFDISINGDPQGRIIFGLFGIGLFW